jgi:putative hydrolases of HD superfamily
VVNTPSIPGLINNTSRHPMIEILTFIKTAEALKRELRHSWLSDDRQESVAEHCWRLTLMAMTIAPEVNPPLDILKILKLLIIHDLPECTVGDIPVFEIDDQTKKSNKQDKERAAMVELCSKLPSATGEEFIALWEEFEAKDSPEARFAQAIDKLEAQVQHNQASFDTLLEWEKFRSFSGLEEYCKEFPVLLKFNALLQEDSRRQFVAAGANPEDYSPK